MLSALTSNKSKQVNYDEVRTRVERSCNYDLKMLPRTGFRTCEFAIRRKKTSTTDGALSEKSNRAWNYELTRARVHC